VQNADAVASLAAVPLLWLLGPPPAAAQTGWNDWQQCKLDIQGPAYKDTQIHTWFVTGASTAPTSVTADWSITGFGCLSNSAGTAQWTTNGGATGGKFDVTMGSGGMVWIKATHSPQMTAAKAITGTAELGSKIEADWGEYPFPPVQGQVSNNKLTGSSSNAHVGPPHYGFRQTGNSTTTASCTWSFADGSIPAPPTPISTP
jgi:hypothetical protein